jgi:hypothetical protein
MFPRLIALVLGLMLASGCARKPNHPVEDLSGASDLSGFALLSLKGTRDGERLKVEASFGQSSPSLTVLLDFKVDPQAQLQSGSWTGLDGSGLVEERATTFLGGQSGPPSLGGRFDLMSKDHRARYRISIPLQPLRDRL